MKPLPITAYVATTEDFFSYPDFCFGWDMLRRRLPISNWQTIYTIDLPGWLASHQQMFIPMQEAVLLITDPHIIVSRDCLVGLQQVLDTHPDDVIIPMDSRRTDLPVNLSYATARGADRAVESAIREGIQPVQAQGGFSKVMLMRAKTLMRLLETQWNGALTPNTWISPYALAHDYSGYFESDRAEVIPHLPEGIKCLLDIGGGAGYFAAAAKKALQLEEVHVFEQNPLAAEAARLRVDKVWEGNFLQTNQQSLPSFDCITALDIIEHVESTEAILSVIASLLRPGGTLVASLPNLGHWSVLVDLLEGCWDYAPSGISSRSHLRFFSRSTICDLFDHSDWQLASITPSAYPMPELLRQRISPLGDACSLRLDIESLDAYQFIIQVRRTG